MWSIRRSHQHIRPETLTEYMDDRLEAGALVRADRQLASCEVCRDELESLRGAVVLLRQLPMEAPRRSFTMAAPPPELVRYRPAPPLRLPQWAFAGAASVAAIVLAVLVSADATGLLAPGGRLASTEVAATAPSQQAPEGALALERSQVEDGGTASQARATAAPAATGAPMAEAAPVEPSPAPLAAAVEAPVAGDAQMESGLAAKPPPRAAVEAPEKLDRPAVEPDAAAPLLEAGSEPLQDEEKILAAGPVSRELPTAEPEGTGAFWRVLEGLVAAAGVLFLTGLVLKMTVSRRGDRG
jgi:hypothetical protein